MIFFNRLIPDFFVVFLYFELLLTCLLLKDFANC